MALTYMRHDEHGVTDVYDAASIEANLKNGWVVIDDYQKYHAELIAKKCGASVPAKAEPEVVDAWLNGDAPAKPTLSRKGK